MEKVLPESFFLLLFTKPQIHTEKDHTGTLSRFLVPYISMLAFIYLAQYSPATHTHMNIRNTHTHTIVGRTASQKGGELPGSRNARGTVDRAAGLADG